MPLEGQWRRQHTPLRRLGPRERRVLASFALVTVLACALVLILALRGTSSTSAPGCVDVVGPSTMGAAKYQPCGAQAERFCAKQAKSDDHFAEAAHAACRKAGYP